jgi:hypothetical protein
MPCSGVNHLYAFESLSAKAEPQTNIEVFFRITFVRGLS